MKKFIIKILISIIIVIIFHLLALQFLGGYTDDIYSKIASPEQNSLVIGSSRAAVGIAPEPINNTLNEIGFHSVYNFAFSIVQSPFGPAYFNAIKQKINTEPSQLKRIFIIEVNPWVLRFRNMNSDNYDELDESNLALGKIKNFNSNPNFEYLFKCYKYGYGKIILNTITSPVYIDNNGWTKIDIDMSEEKYKQRFESKIIEYKQKAQNTTLSSARFFYFRETISYLKTFGVVVLVRMPIEKRILQIEDKQFPSFNDSILNISNEYDLLYLDYSGEGHNYKFTDGSHLFLKSAYSFSSELIQQIKHNINTDL